MEKETQLDSEISIKEKFKALSPKEKYSYIWEYYKIYEKSIIILSNNSDSQSILNNYYIYSYVKKVSRH